MVFPCDVTKLLLKFLGASFTLGKMIHLYVLKMEVVQKQKRQSPGVSLPKNSEDLVLGTHYMKLFI